MAKILDLLDPPKTDYVDRRFRGTRDEYFAKLNASATLYVGNLSFYTTEDQVYSLFAKAGRVRRVVMGLDAQRKTPCGFCFVVYDRREDALAAVRYLNGTSLDERPIRVDVDYGFEEGRQFGRGRSGGQVRDEFRTDYDSARGGFGKQLVQQIHAQGLTVRETEAGQVAFVPLQAAAAGAYGGAGAAAARQHEDDGGDGGGGARGRERHEEEEEGGDDGEQRRGGGGDYAAEDDGGGGSPRRGYGGGDDDDDHGGSGGLEHRSKRRRLGSDDDGDD